MKTKGDIFMRFMRSIIEEYKVLLRSVPSTVIAAFVLSVVLMNLLAGREMSRSDWFCLNTGLSVSWISFLCMDVICKRFGQRAANLISVLAMGVNIFCAVGFALLMKTPGRWAAFYSSSDPNIAQAITEGIDATFSGAWYVVAGSSIALFVSSLVNSFLNVRIGKTADNGRYSGFAIRSLLSTCAGQFVDNFVFSALVSHVFFGWTWPQVLICSFTSMIIELVFEAVFSPLGYRIVQNWEKDEVGKNYVDLHPEVKPA